MDDIVSWGRAALGVGLEAKEIGTAPMMLRAVVVYLVTILVARLGKKRFMGRATAFDVILGIMLGSIASRAITGNAPLVPTLAATAALVGLHYLLSAATCRWHGFGTFLKGCSRILIRDGVIDQEELRKAHMSEHDLWEDLRGQGIGRLERVAEARLERSGRLSVLKAKPPPRIVEIAIEDGVKTVRLEIG